MLATKVVDLKLRGIGGDIKAIANNYLRRYNK
jgi:hypothetical protein